MMMAAGILVTVGGVALVVGDREEHDGGEFSWVGYLLALGSAVCQAVGNIMRNSRENTTHSR